MCVSQIKQDGIHCKPPIAITCYEELTGPVKINHICKIICDMCMYLGIGWCSKDLNYFKNMQMSILRAQFLRPTPKIYASYNRSTDNVLVSGFCYYFVKIITANELKLIHLREGLKRYLTN